MGLVGLRAAVGRRQLSWTRVGAGLGWFPDAALQLTWSRQVAAGYGPAERPSGAKGVAPMAWDPQLRAPSARGGGPLLPTLPVRPSCEAWRWQPGGCTSWPHWGSMSEVAHTSASIARPWRGARGASRRMAACRRLQSLPRAHGPSPCQPRAGHAVVALGPTGGPLRQSCSPARPGPVPTEHRRPASAVRRPALQVDQWSNVRAAALPRPRGCDWWSTGGRPPRLELELTRQRSNG